MKAVLAIATFVIASNAIAADHYVRPHVTKNGTYVEGHMQSDPNSSRMDNYSTQGNTNPYTGQAGTVNPYNSPYPTPNPYAVQPNPYANPYPNPYGR